MIAINRQERDVLRHELKTDMDAIGDLSTIANRGDPGQLWHETRRRYSVAMHLLDDIGWSDDDPRDTFYVTLPAAAFRRWLQDLRAEAEGVLLEHAECFAVAGHVTWYSHVNSDEEAAQELRESRVRADRDLDRRSVCVALLDRLAEGGDA